MMTWEEICADPGLRDLPYKIETNRCGQIVMTPIRAQRGEVKSRISFLLRGVLSTGHIMISCPVQTTAGVRVPDVAWASPERRQPVIYNLAPEICVEAMSPYNDQEEMDEKRALYFEAGALEVWLCAEDDRMTFYGPDGLLPGGSRFCPAFPVRVEV